MKYEEQFIEWLYENFTISNGEALCSYLEDGDTYNTFLAENGLEDE